MAHEARYEASHLQLFTMPNVEDVREHLLGQDVIWVSGGSVAGLLAMWRLHGVDAVMREAWEAGVVLTGVSAGSLCWHVGGTTDSFGPELRPVDNGLALLPFSNGVHYDSEPERRPLFQSLVADGTLPPATPPTTAPGCTTAAPSWSRRSPSATAPAATASSGDPTAPSRPRSTPACCADPGPTSPPDLRGPWAPSSVEVRGPSGPSHETRPAARTRPRTGPCG